MENNTNDPANRPRITPRNSDLEESSEAIDTPWRTLNQLANIPRTPLRRASSAGPPSTRRSQRPASVTATPGSGRGVGFVKGPKAVTPHGRAAQRELDLRRAGMTPGKDRRRSGRQQRETPRDILRQLSRVLAPKTAPVVPTPEGRTASKPGGIGSEDWEDGPDPERPRFSLPLGDDEDESLLLPPQSAGLEDENFTLQSVEYGRRARSEQPLSRLSRGSFGTVFMSDADDSRVISEVFDSSIFAGDDQGGMPFLGDEEGLQGEYTGVLAGLGLDRGRFSLASGRDSDILRTAAGDDTDTFVFNVPPRDITEDVPTPLPNFDDSIAEIEVVDGDEEVQPKGIEITDEEEEEEDDEDVNTFIAEDEDPVDEVGAEDQEDSNLQYLDGDTSMLEVELGAVANLKPGTVRKKKVKLSRHGIQYPSLPAGVVKKLATTFARTAGNKAKISKESLDAIMQASDWFFEQVSEDLGAYAGHAGRKTIDESDVVTLMTRQRQINATTTPFSLAQKHLPRELLQELRMVPPAKLKAGRQLQTVEEEVEE